MRHILIPLTTGLTFPSLNVLSRRIPAQRGTGSEMSTSTTHTQQRAPPYETSPQRRKSRGTLRPVQDGKEGRACTLQEAAPSGFFPATRRTTETMVELTSGISLAPVAPWAPLPGAFGRRHARIHRQTDTRFSLALHTPGGCWSSPEARRGRR